MTGIWPSMSTRSNVPATARATASSPFRASVTENPSWRSIVCSIAAFAGSSSATRTLPRLPSAEPVAEQLRTAKLVKTWVEFEVVDDHGKPRANEPYRCMLPDGTIREGQTDSRGKVRFDGIDPGNCAFTLTRISPKRWKPA